jgi:D-3-phosphoglycerate dehydrogenase
VKALLIEYPSFRPWDAEEAAVADAGGRLTVTSYERFAAAPADADVLLNACGEAVQAELLDAMPSLRCAVCYGVGLDWIELDEASRRGIMVVNMPLANVEDVATHALTLILACARRLVELDRFVRDGGFEWPWPEAPRRLRGRRLGLLAFGNIPRILARFVVPFGLTVSAYDPYVSAETMLAAGVEPAELEALLASSHILSVHVPSTPETRGLLDERRLALLPAGAIVVATSRGDVYDAEALARALERGRISAAGLDVFPEEPLPPGHPLTRLSNVILTPHVAGHSEESIRDVHGTAVAIIGALARGEAPPGLVNAEAR